MGMRKWMDAWGYYLLAAVCVGVILFSAVWTCSLRSALPDAQALSDQSQRLSDVTPAPTARPLQRPCEGAVLRPFSLSPVYFEETGLWLVHPAVDYRAAAGDPVCAMAEGTVSLTEDGLRLDHGNGLISVYRGLADIQAAEGQTVRAGEVIGHAGGRVLFEGSGFVCVALYQEGEAVDPEEGRFWGAAPNPAGVRAAPRTPPPADGT